MSPLEKVREFLERAEEKNIKFKQHFHDKALERPISENLVRECIKKKDKLLKVEKQTAKKEGEEKYKMWFELSGRYDLVIIAVISKKGLYIITGWNSDRKWQKAIQR
jgi:hypothetical protein